MKRICAWYTWATPTSIGFGESTRWHITCYNTAPDEDELVGSSVPPTVCSNNAFTSKEWKMHTLCFNHMFGKEEPLDSDSGRLDEDRLDTLFRVESLVPSGRRVRARITRAKQERKRNQGTLSRVCVESQCPQSLIDRYRGRV